jgi:hypothetical protein
MESLVLFVVALLIGIFAVARGAYWDDPYPGYGPLHRSMMEHRDRTEELALQLSSEVDRAKDEADQAMAQVTQKAQSTVGGLRNALSRAENGGEGWDRSNAELIAEGRAALELYRDANANARTTAEPAYFNDDPFRSMTPPSGASVIASLESALARSTQKITQTKSQLAGARAQLEAEYQSFYEDELAPYLKTMSGDAAKRVRDEFGAHAHADADAPRLAVVETDDAETEEGEPEPIRVRRSRRRF